MLCALLRGPLALFLGLVCSRGRPGISNLLALLIGGIEEADKATHRSGVV